MNAFKWPGAAVAFFLMSLPGWLPVQAQSEGVLSVEAKAQIKKAMSAPKAVSYVMVQESFKGPMTQAFVGASLRKFMAEVISQDLGKNLEGGADARPYVMLNDNPEKAKAVKMDIAYRLKTKVTVKAPLEVHEVVWKNAARYTYNGPHTRLNAVWSEMVVATKGGKMKPRFPMALHLLTNPNTVKSADDNKTEVIVPLGE